MDLRPPFTVTGKSLKTKTDGKPSEEPKTKVKEPLINRGKRVFGTVRNQNAIAKIPTEKPTKKPGIPQKPTDGTPKKPSEKKKIVNLCEENEEMSREGDVSAGALAETPLRSPSLVKLRKKSVNFREHVKKNKVKVVAESDVPGAAGAAQTPLRSPFLVAKPNAQPGTPYHSAERCSKCRFDKLETSSYWLGQIRLAESVGKHFVSAAFFRLASDCNAEPNRNIKVELKKYLARHEHLSGEKDWRDLCVSYGLVVEEESRVLCHENQEEERRSEVSANNIEEQEDKQIMEPVSVENADELS